MTIYVDSNAAGANNGTSWTDAYVLLSSSSGATAGENVLVEYRHTEASATSVDINWSNGTYHDPVRIISVDKDNSDAYRTGGTVDTTTLVSNDITFRGAICCYGLTLDTKTGTTDSIYLNSTGLRHWFYDCTFTSDWRIIACYTNSFNVFENCTFTADDRLFAGTGENKLVFRNCNITSSGSDVLVLGWHTEQTAILEGCDLTGGATNVIDDTGYQRVHVTLRGCELPASWTVNWNLAQTTVEDCSLLIEGCTDGAITVPELGLTEFRLPTGITSSSLSRYRTGGADDGEQANAHSWSMVSNTIAKEVVSPMWTPPMTAWVAGGSSVTLTIYLAGGATLNDDDFWIEVRSPDETGSPNQTSRQNFYSSRVNDPLATPSALTTDSGSTWNGTGVGTKQKISRTFTPTEAGPVVVRCYLAKPSTTVYVDPKIEIA